MLKDRKSTLQAIVVSTGYEIIPCTLKELDAILDKWIANGVFKPNHISREPTEDKRRDLHFYRLHNYVQHATTKCKGLYRLLHCIIKERTLELL